MFYVDFVEHSKLGPHAFADWFEGFGGQFVSVLGTLGLLFLCYFLARWGGRMQLEEEREAEQSGGS
jgi:hypothetical protein